MDRITLWRYAAVVCGVLTAVTFAYSVVLVPGWNWMKTIPDSFRSTPRVSSTASSNTANTRRGSPSGASTPAAYLPDKPDKPVNCGRIIKQIKSGQSVSLPAECEQTYQAVKDQERAKFEREKLQADERQRELDRERIERENSERIEFARQQELERRQREVEQQQLAQAERERRQQAEENRREQQRQDSERQATARESERRQRERQRQEQKRNEAIIRLGIGIGNKIFKRRN